MINTSVAMTNALILGMVTRQDTVLAALPRDGLETAADISLIVMAVGSGLALLAVAAVLLQIRKLLKSLNGQLQPVTDRARVAAENVEYISAIVREDIQKVNESIGAITGRLNEASDHMEDRVHEFNALMEVVQGEAEEMFLDTAATVRGVREGARAITESAAARSTERRAPSDDEMTPPAETTEEPIEENAAAPRD